MTLKHSATLEEIRFNEKYAHHYRSEYTPAKYSADSVPTIKKKTLFTQDYLQRLNQSAGIKLYPPNCRYVEEVQNGYMVVIEEPPAFRTIRVNMGMGQDIERLKYIGKTELATAWKTKNPRGPYSFTLAMPYVIFLLYITKYNEINIGEVYLRTQQMTGLSDYILKAPMCNISSEGYICFGNKIGGRHRSLTAAIQHAIMVFWSAEFNTDYTYNYYAYKRVPILHSYIEWQYMSNENPMFIYNADWIREKLTLGQRIQHTKQYSHISSKQAVGYKELADIFYMTQETSLEAKAYKSARKAQRLFADIAQGMYLTSDCAASVGDTITLKNGKTAFIDTFVGFADGSDAQYIQFDTEGRKFLVKLHKKAKYFISKMITDQKRLSEITLPNGVTIKPDDVVILKRSGRDTYHRVDYIRRSRGADDQEIHEIRIGNEYHLSSKLDVTVFEMDSPEVDGVKIEKGKQYIVVGERNHSGAMTPGYRMEYHNYEVTEDGNIILRFKNLHPDSSSSRNIDLSQQRSGRVIYNLEDVKRINGVFYVGRNLYWMRGREEHQPQEEVVWGVNGVTLKDGNFSLKKITGSHFTKMLLEEDHFHIEGALGDIDFAIGDKVVCANWENPLDVLTVKMIQGFKLDENTGDLSFILADREGKLSEQKYIDGQYSVISLGKIRKVTNKVGRLTAGTKIKARTAGISCFPKKDVNIIVAFIIDTGGEPLVLCSNGCTLWLSDVEENFTKITMKSKRWAKMEHAPLDLSKIKFQAGDIINGRSEYKNNHGYLLYGPSMTRSLRALPFEYYGSYPESYCLDTYMTRECILDCIPAPRMTSSQAARAGSLQGVYNPLTYDVHENHVSTTYINQRRS